MRKKPLKRAAKKDFKPSPLRPNGEGPMRVEDLVHFDATKIPADMSYEWKRMSVLGQPDPVTRRRYEADGWRPVRYADHPELTPKDSPKFLLRLPIQYGGLQLMKRPKELTLQAIKEDAEIAAKQASRFDFGEREGVLDIGAKWTVISEPKIAGNGKYDGSKIIVLDEDASALLPYLCHALSRTPAEVMKMALNSAAVIVSRIKRPGVKVYLYEPGIGYQQIVYVDYEHAADRRTVPQVPEPKIIPAPSGDAT